MLSRTLPIILCGRSEAIASVVRQNLLPDVKVIHTILSIEQGKSEIPALLQRTGDERPAAIVTGAAYTDPEVGTMQEACRDGVHAGVYWLRADTKIPTPPPGPDYGKHMTGRVKACLEKLEQEGRIGKAEAGEQVYY